MLIHDLAFALQEENTGRLMGCLKWIGNSYPEYPILSQFCVELINALNASELVTPPDTFKDRNEEKFQDYVKAWMHLLTTDTPTGIESIPHVEDVYLATAAASVLTIYKFQTQEKSRRKPISLASFGRAEIALRKILLAEHKLLDEFRSRTSDLWQYLSTLRALESNGTFSKKITENRIKPLRLIFEYALGEREGKHEHTKSILPEILSILVEDDSDNVDEPTRVIRTRTGEDGNFNHIPAKENTYDGPASKSYVEPPRAEKAKPTAVSPHLQHRINDKISQRLVMAQVLSGASHKALSDKDVALLRKECFELLSTEDLQSSPTWENALFLLLSLITGRSIRFLRNLQFKSQTAKGFPGEPCWIWHDLQCYLYDVPDIPRSRCPDMVGELDARNLFSQEKTAGFFVQIPDEVAERLVRHRNSSIPKKNRLSETASQTLSAFGSLRDRNVSLTKVQAHLRLNLKRAGIDDVVAGYICGKTADQLPAMYYTQVSQADITAAHTDYLAHLGFASSPIAPHDGKIGSMLSPKPGWVRDLLGYIREQIALVDTGKRDDLFNHHNYLMLYTYLILCLSTGHRPVKAPFQYLRDFDLISGFVWISDKVVRTNHASRIVPLCGTAVQQIQYYVRHLHQLRDRLRHNDYESSHYLEGILKNKTPLLFVFDEEGHSSLTPKVLQTWHGFISALPGNWHRHTLRSLLTGDVPHECLNAFMGHALLGVGPMSHTSGFEFASLSALKDPLEHTMQTYGGIALEQTPQQYTIEPYHAVGDHTAHIGRTGREKNRTHLLKRAAEKCAEIQAEIGFCSMQITTAEKYEHTLSKVEKQLRSLNLSAEQYCHAKRQLQKSAKKIIDTHGLIVSLPSVPSQVSFEPSFRTEKWFTYSRYIHVWDEGFYERLEKFSRSSQEDDLTLIGLILYSAAARGGLAHPKMLADLALNLSNPTIKPQSVGSYVWFDLDIPIDGKEGRYSIKVGNKCHQHRHWFVDEVSLALIIRLYKKRSSRSNISLGQTRLLKANVFDLIKKAIFGDGPNQTSITDLEKLTTAALWRHDCSGGPGISEALQSLAMGNFQTFSIDRKSWTGLFSPTPVATEMSVPVSYKADDRKAPSRYRAEDPHVWGSFYENHLIPVVRPVLHNCKKVKTSDVLVKLEALKETRGLPTHLLLVLDWLIDVGKRSVKPSTIQRYCSTFVSVWLLETHGRIPDLQDAEELEELYDNLLTYHDSPGEAAYMLGRMADFHAFGMRDNRYRLPQIEKQRWHQFKRHSRVRTKVLSFRQIQAAIDLMTSGEPSVRERRKISLFVMLAYRTGMRLIELVKLQLKDVEASDDFFISIRDNQFGNNKSRAGRRQINLRVFLNDRELGEFKSLMAQNARKTNRNLPVFSYGNTGSPYHGGQISKMFSKAIAQITDDEDIVFHSLRHSCLSCLHATLEGEAEIAHMIVGLSAEKLEAIREHLMGHIDNRMGLYYTLAAFAGHAGPKETMLSYLHLSDLIVFTKLQRQPLKIGIDKLAQIASVQGSKIENLEPADRYEYLVRQKVPLIAVSYPFTLPAEQGISQSNSISQPKIRAEYDLMLVDEILRALQEGSKARDLAFIYDVDREVIESWHKNAIELQSLQTRRGNSRLYSKGKETSLVPNAQKDNLVRVELDKICRCVHLKLEHRSAVDIEQFAKGILAASSPDARTYRIHDPAFAAEIVNFLRPEVQTGRWEMEVDIPEGPDFEASKKKWKHYNPWLSEDAFKSHAQKISAHHRAGIGMLHLKHPAKTAKSGLPRLVAYLIAVAYGTPK